MSPAAGYSGTPLPKKLGIKPDHVVALLDAPPEMTDRLGELPSAVDVRSDLRRTGLVDNKVCAVSDVWSGPRVVHRKENRR